MEGLVGILILVLLIRWVIISRRISKMTRTAPTASGAWPSPLFTFVPYSRFR